MSYGHNTTEKGRKKYKASWKTIGGKRNYYRSQWEANYALYLQWLKDNNQIKDWEHEPETFWFDGIRRGTVSYLPDFKVVEKSGAEHYHEVKGYMDPKSKTKLNRMKKYHPAVKLILIDAKQYANIAIKVKQFIAGWE